MGRGLLVLSIAPPWAKHEQPNLFAALRTAIDLKLFEKLDDHDAAPMSAENLAIATGSDPALVGQLIPYAERVQLQTSHKIRTSHEAFCSDEDRSRARRRYVYCNKAVQGTSCSQVSGRYIE